uniref:Uncharacterized protein n=1 Tax=Anguilla anguilla TaxID=7936 RepID=A0A0E9SIH1_ANGAN
MYWSAVLTLKSTNVFEFSLEELEPIRCASSYGLSYLAKCVITVHLYLS